MCQLDVNYSEIVTLVIPTVMFDLETLSEILV